MASDSVHLPLITILHHSIIFLLLFKLPSCLSSNPTYSNCANLISCGQIRNIGFPFWGGNRPRECGHPLMELICENEISYITINDVKYQVLDANPDSHTLKITRQDYSIDLCQPNQASTSLNTQLYVYDSPYNNLSLSYGCTPSEFLPPNYIPCNRTSGETVYSQFGSLSPVSCKTSVVVPVPLSLQEIDSFFQVYRAIKEGFVVRWIIGVEECDKCEKSGGECGFEGPSQQTICYCRDVPCPNFSPDDTKAFPGKRKVSLPIWILIIVPTTVFITFIFLCYYLIKRKPKKSNKSLKKSNKSLLRENFGNESLTLEPLQFNLATLKAATNNFSDENRIGKGGFGEVYKGILFDGQHVAVKRLSKNSTQGAKEFKNEVSVIAKLQHRNLVTLVGFCLEEQTKILIYEYVPNKSLDYFLFDSQLSKLLSWTKRYDIIIGIARGIFYLHELSRLKVIHRDLKPSNVLLDENMIPKISDFGLARIVEINQDQVSTNKIVGTFGYMSPEYVMFGKFSEKSDIFSFGVMVLEIVTGEKNLSSHKPHYVAEGLLSYVWRQWRAQTWLEILDPNIKENYSEIEVTKCIQIGLLCVQQNPDVRPTMTNVLSYFSSYFNELPNSQEPAFFLNERTNPTIFAPQSSINQPINNSIPLSTNKMSVSEFLPR
ncbi:cysteine-rich receptor-like protein kinase 44 [Vigna angularis]|uniref:cysteine-rich receptor-like protein kinase 44 n=1 Tax=Phaseolus angularis TaxID=3914 RepID=UPI0022B32BC0|nr:cysteine-rich receptor-like protein kinase 44 [Vigna angularis]